MSSFLEKMFASFKETLHTDLGILIRYALSFIWHFNIWTSVLTPYM